MANAPLSKRERLILQALVKAYIAIGDPIGSRTLFRRENLGIAPATIRHILASLEEKGFVQQPHTSAGRVPTDRGYRFYVEESVVGDGDWQVDGEAELREQLDAKFQQENIDQILGQLAKILGDISQQLGLVMAPRFEQGIFHKLELIQLAEKRLLLVVTIRQGVVKSLVIEMDSNLSQRNLETMSRLLNERLNGLSMAEIRRSVRHRLRSLAAGNPQLLRVVAEEIEEMANPSGSGLYVAGTGNICLQPEFSDPLKVAGLMDLVEEKDRLAHILRDREGMVITIGKENRPRAMRLCSMVTASYEVNGARGVIGVIGPTRMPYGRVVSLVRHAAARAAGLVS